MEGKDVDSPSAYRPICLLNEVGKLFKRIIATRLDQHPSLVGPDLDGAQFGFREGRSMIDAINHVKALSETSQGGIMLAVSLDISNVFNSLSWDKIMESLGAHGVPDYLVCILRDYLRDRSVVYTDQNGSAAKRELHRGVSRGPCWDHSYGT